MCLLHIVVKKKKSVLWENLETLAVKYRNVLLLPGWKRISTFLVFDYVVVKRSSHEAFLHNENK